VRTRVLRADLIAHRDAGVTTVRVAGAPGRLPGRVGEDAELPRVISAGPWLSTPGLFFPGWGRKSARRTQDGPDDQPDVHPCWSGASG